ncbi:MAG: efflux transporter outer membrane subunit [Desulfobacterales bacterium]|nr:efflux transporter outer membrane subunit [Desulfobacterales bacterium]
MILFRNRSRRLKSLAWIVRISLWAIISLSQAGCTLLGPDFSKPGPGLDIPPGYKNQGISEAGGETAGITEKWWREFNNNEINELVARVLRNNLDIKKAAEQIVELASRFTVTRADRFPGIGLQGLAQRRRQTVDFSMSIRPGDFSSGDTEDTDTFNLSLPASFEIDLWGRLMKAEEAALAGLLQARENRQVITQGLVAEALICFFEIESLERRIQVAKQQVQNLRQSLELVERRYERGLTSILDVKQANRSLYQAQAVLPVLLQDLGVAQQRLAVLQGRYPDSRPARGHPEEYFRKMPPVPAGLPSDLLKRRPDIRGAEAELKMLNALVGVAKASRFPRIALTADFGYINEELDRLFKPASELWDVALGLTQPIFDAGKLRAGQKAAESRYRSGLIDYAKTVLNAFAEVEGALLTRQRRHERRGLVLELLNEARMAQEIAEERYQRGLVDYLIVLDAQRARFQAEDSLVSVDLSILSARVNLYRALGGGWTGTLTPAAAD